MVNQSVPWIDISGNYEERLQTAINAVDTKIQEFSDSVELT